MPILKPKERLGTKIAGRYKLTEILGKGGMGTVFGGAHVWTGREVAIKILHPLYADDEEVVRRFLQEARSAAKLNHPHVVDVLDMGQDDDDTVYLVLPRLRGEPLNERVARGPIPAEEAVRLLEPIMDALALAHDAEIVHRDLKPANIYLAEDPRHGVVPILLDFGIAKVAGDTVQTVTGAVLGTPWYMSPEQATAMPTIGPPSDVWSMAVVLYEALTGARFFKADSSAAALAQIVAAPHAPDLEARLEEEGRKLPEALRAVIEEALRREPEERPSMREMARRSLAAVGLSESAARKTEPEAEEAGEENSPPEAAAKFNSSLDTRPEEDSAGEEEERGEEEEIPETVTSSPRTEAGAEAGAEAEPASEPEPEPAASSPIAAPPPRADLRPWMIGAVVILVLGALGVGLALGGQGGAEGSEVGPSATPEPPELPPRSGQQSGPESGQETPETPPTEVDRAGAAPPDETAESPPAEVEESGAARTEPEPRSTGAGARTGHPRAHHGDGRGGEERREGEASESGSGTGAGSGAGVFEVGL